MGHVTSKMTERYFDPLADNGAGTAAMAWQLGVEDGEAEISSGNNSSQVRRWVNARR